MIYIFSAPRSGSTWVGKIFDSHPDVLYLHEPEIADRGLDLLPYWSEGEPTQSDIEAARRYLERMLSARSPRSTGTRPFFPKNYRSAMAETCHRALIYAAKGLERLDCVGLTDRVYIPDLADRGKPGTTVIKSVSALGRAAALIKANGSSLRPILLIRHPCAYVSSMLRGSALGVMTVGPTLGRLLDTSTSRRLGVSAENLREADQAEKLAWSWLLSNGEAYSAIQGASGIILIYEELVRDVIATMTAVFEQVGLGWTSQTELFLRRAGESDGGYYSVFRDGSKAANRWRAELDKPTTERVRAIVMRDPIGRLFFDS
jgi:hypothetical protein